MGSFSTFAWSISVRAIAGARLCGTINSRHEDHDDVRLPIIYCAAVLVGGTS